MAFQMVYTSIRSGLVVGRSGFCTAARHREIPDLLAGRIEDFSARYERGGTGANRECPVVFSHRKVVVRDVTYHVLSRTGDAGNDYTGRSNHITHSIVLEPGEIASLEIGPAEAILSLVAEGRWLERFEGEARYFTEAERLDLGGCVPSVSLPATTWERVTGSSANAASLFSPGAGRGAGIVDSSGAEDPGLYLSLFAEAALISSPDRRGPSKLWDHSFTTRLQSVEERPDFDWFVLQQNSPTHLAMVKAGGYLLELQGEWEPLPGRLSDIAAGRAVPGPEEEPPKEEARVIAPREKASPPPEVTAAPAAPAARIRETPAVVAELRSDSSRKRSGREKSGAGVLPWVIAGAAVLGVVIAFLIVSGQSPGKAEEELAAFVAAGDWDSARELIGELGEEEQFRLRGANRFLELEAATKRAGRLVSFRDRLLNGEEKRDRRGEELDRILRDSGGVDSNDFPSLANLEREVRELVESIGKIEESFAGAWTELDDMAVSGKEETFSAKMEEVGAGLVATNRFQGSPLLAEWLAQVGYLEKVAPRVRELGNLPSAFSHPDEVEKVLAWKRTTLPAIASLVKRSEKEGRSWTGHLAAIQRKIGRLDPGRELASSGEKPEAAPASAEPGRKERPGAEEKAGAGFSKIYLFPLSGDRGYGLDGIAEFRETPTHVLSGPPSRGGEVRFPASSNVLRYRDEVNLYSNDGRELLFAVEKGVLRPKSAGLLVERGMDRGFLLRFRATEGGDSGEIGFQIAALDVSEESRAPGYLLSLSPEEGLEKDGKTGTIGLSEKAKTLLARLRFQVPAGEWKFSLEPDDGAVSTVAGTGLGELRFDPAAGLESEITALEAALASVERAGELRRDFAAAFGELGKRFANEEGKLMTHEATRERIGGGRFLIQARPREAEGVELCLSLAEFENHRHRKQHLPALIDYVNHHLVGDILRYQGGADMAKSRFNRDGNSERIYEHSVDVPFNENRMDEFVDQVVDGWRTLAELSAERKWSKRPSTGPVKEGDIANLVRVYAADRFFADFFRVWEEVFTEKNLEIARSHLMAASGSPVADPALIRKKLETKREERAAIRGRDAGAVGQFYLDRIVELPPSGGGAATGGRFRILYIGPGS